MFRRFSLSHPHRPHLHLLVAVLAVLVAAVILFFAVQSAGGLDTVELSRPHLVVMNISQTIQPDASSDTPR